MGCLVMGCLLMGCLVIGTFSDGMFSDGIVIGTFSDDTLYASRFRALRRAGEGYIFRTSFEQDSSHQLCDNYQELTPHDVVFI